MIDILTKCDDLYKKQECCHPKSKKKVCYCYDCLVKGFYLTSDTYDCPKKHYYYVMNYGPSFASEVYNYLKFSKILEKNYNGQKIKILSLGCGFGPDLIAVDKYIQDEELNIEFEYSGYDASKEWNIIRRKNKNAKFFIRDLTSGFNLSDYDIIFIVKLFSTLYCADLEDAFLAILKDQINKNLKKDSFMIFIDINNKYKGRDKFDNEVKNLFSSVKHYYYDIRCRYHDSFKEIKQYKIAFDIPDDLSVKPMLQLNNTIVFEYKK